MAALRLPWRLNRDRKTFNRMASRAFERANVETLRCRFDAGKPHRLAAFRTGQDSDFSATTKKWIGMDGGHSAPLPLLRRERAAHSQSPMDAEGGAVMETSMEPKSSAAMVN